jgi:hypothetical protein
MISLNSRDHENQPIESFASEDLSTLFTTQDFPVSLFPSIGQISPTWNADDRLMNMLAFFCKNVTPQEKILPGQQVTKPLTELSDEDKAVILKQGGTHTTLNGQAVVIFTAPLVEAAPAAPIGYSDLLTLIEFLKRARNENAQLETVSL